MILARLSRLMAAQDARRIPAFLTAAAVAGVLQGLALALVVPVLDALLTGAHTRAILWCAAMLAATLASWAASHAAALAGFELALAVLRNVRRQIGDHLAALPLGWFTPLHTARLSVTISQGVMQLLALPAHQLLPLVRAAVVPPVLVLAIALFDIRLALAAAATFPLLALVYWWGGRLGQAADRAVHHAAEEAGQRVMEYAQAQSVLRAFGVTQRGHAALKDALTDLAHASRRQIWMVLPPLVANSWLVQLGFLGLMALTALMVLGGSAGDAPVLIALLVLVNRVLEPLGDVAAASAGIRMASGELAHVEGILAEPPLPAPSRPAALPARHDIRFEAVRFAYAPGTPVLDDLDVTLAENTTTALVGASGAGKSTVLHLLARFCDVSAGAVRIGGTDVRDLDPAALAGLIAPVFQTTHLFSGTIRDNVLMARPEADAAALAHVARLARLDEMLARLPGGWACEVGEGGHGLSGGERQRVCIARALLKDAPILLLDEPTSALDAENRQALTRLLATLRGRRTIVVVAHQFEWMSAADRVLVLEGGRLVEDGAPAALLARGGRYAALHRAAHGG
ncbi:ABC transporter [Azorhizobium oxalatiphilum]|uniref:ABC transporter n=1 Tax=Azorhizobium oxalatiphilum TaxID=980631 RepID=A0A917CE96_9HYPH|nr:ABC transporter ATP-binding protein [Azorhizobium oxalatiphilum]GGF86171.1 ABC transporter [Azorhizobium oxalatiphilum]